MRLYKHCSRRQYTVCYIDIFEAIRFIPLKYLSVGFRIILTIVFFGTGVAKFAGLEIMTQSCEQIGWGEGFRHAIAGGQMIGAVMLWMPGKQFFAAVSLLVISTVYLSLCHYILVGSYTFIITALTVSLAFIHRDQI